MNESSKQILTELRKERGFCADKYIGEKVKLINLFFQQEKLDAVVVGVSGGIDSAVAYELLREAMETEGSPIKKICGVHVESSLGSSNTNEAYLKARLVTEDLKYVFIGDAIAKIVGNYENSFAVGQLVPMVRSSIFYYQAALLQQQGFRSVLAGTINRDEGGYVGYWGKYSDGAADIQIIGDIHKSEIREVAKALGVNREIIDRAPTGDVWNGLNDQQMIGATYDEIEFYTLLREADEAGDERALGWIDQLVWKDKDEELNKAFLRIEELNKANLHKYKREGLALFLDVMKRKTACWK